MSMPFNQGRCDDRHKAIDRELKSVWARMNGFDKKLWALIVMVLGTLVAVLVK